MKTKKKKKLLWESVVRGFRGWGAGRRWGGYGCDEDRKPSIEQPGKGLQSEQMNADGLRAFVVMADESPAGSREQQPSRER